MVNCCWDASRGLITSGWVNWTRVSDVGKEPKHPITPGYITDDADHMAPRETERRRKFEEDVCNIIWTITKGIVDNRLHSMTSIIISYAAEQVGYGENLGPLNQESESNLHTSTVALASAAKKAAEEHEGGKTA